VKWTFQAFVFGTVNFAVIKMKIKSLVAIQNLVKLHNYAGWLGNILMAKTNHTWFHQEYARLGFTHDMLFLLRIKLADSVL
jgi:hypothetical protein